MSTMSNHENGSEIEVGEELSLEQVSLDSVPGVNLFDLSQNVQNPLVVAMSTSSPDEIDLLRNGNVCNYARIGFYIYYYYIILTNHNIILGMSTNEKKSLLYIYYLLTVLAVLVEFIYNSLNIQLRIEFDILSLIY